MKLGNENGIAWNWRDGMGLAWEWKEEGSASWMAFWVWFYGWCGLCALWDEEQYLYYNMGFFVDIKLL